MHPFTLTKRIDICPGPDIHSVPSHHQHICANPGRTKRRLHAGTCDFGSFPHIKLQTENLSVHAYTPLSLSLTHTPSLAPLLIAQEILSARGQLQAH